MSLRGIDVSENNGRVDWAEVADAGAEFAIIRASYGKTGEDSMFAANAMGALAAGLKVGAYHYSYALTPEDAALEAENCRNVIDSVGALLELPVFYDMEDTDGWKRDHDFDDSPENITVMCSIFIHELALNGGVYASEDWLNSKIDWRSLGVPVWNASWPYSAADGQEQIRDMWLNYCKSYSDNDGINGYAWQFTDGLEIGGRYFDADIIRI